MPGSLLASVEPRGGVGHQKYVPSDRPPLWLGEVSPTNKLLYNHRAGRKIVSRPAQPPLLLCCGCRDEESWASTVT